MSAFVHLSATFVTLLLLIAFLTPTPAAAGPGSGRSGKGCGQAFDTRFKEIEKTKLTPAEIEQIVYMREEEKLARDVYRTLGRIWKLRIFSNIETAEQKHMDHILMVLKLYDLKDPVVDDSEGAFTNKRLDALYDELVKKGKKSLVDALQVGMTIEDVDIFDLNKLLAAATNDHVKIVAYNLVKGSRNHMRAFSKTLVANKGTYAAQFLEQAEIDAIVAGDKERGIVYDENGDPLADAGCGAGRGRGKGGGGRGKGGGGGGKGGAGGGDGSGQGNGPGRGRGR